MIRPGIRRLFSLGLRRGDAAEREAVEEIREHIHRRTEQLVARGWSPAEARAEAERRFGSVPEARRAARRSAARRGLRDRLAAVGADLRFAARGLAREPGLTAVVVVVIALGVGANAAMFGILDRLLLRGPEHVVAPEQVARIYYTVDVPGRGRFKAATFGYVTYALMRDDTRTLSSVGAQTGVSDATLGSGESAARLRWTAATWDFFPTLGVKPELGRFYDATEDRPGDARAVVVIGDGLWRRRFGADPGVLGRDIEIEGSRFTVIGVAPKGFTGVEMERVDAWVPMSIRSASVTEDWPHSWNAQWLKVVARLKPGVPAEEVANDATRAFRAAYTGDDPPLEKARITADPIWYDENGHEALRVTVARWLVGVSLLVLLVACANVANLLLARAVRRRREIAVRLALGISRGRLLRLLLSHSLLLALLGGAAALAVVPVAGRLVRSALLPDVEWTAPPLDGRVLAVAAGLTLLVGVGTGLVPLFQAGRGRLNQGLRDDARSGGSRASGLRTSLTVLQAAFSVVLLVGAGLFVRSLRNARSLDLGIEPEHVLIASADWPRPASLDEALRLERRTRDARFYASALERARALPDVRAAALAIGVPFRSSYTQRLQVPGVDSIPHLAGGGPYIQAVSPGYFETVGLRVLEGRAFGPGDREGSEPVAVVNRTMARTLWPRGNALGSCLRTGPGDEERPCARVVGVVEDAHRFEIREPPAMQYYVPLGQEQGMGGTYLLVRPRGPASAAVTILREALRPLDPSILWIQVERLSDSLDPELQPWRLGAMLVGVFGLLALVIAAVGLYSLVAYLVASRTHELGVRQALGATPGDVVRLVVRRGIGLAGAGIALGLVLAFLAAPRMRDVLFEASPRDPAVYLVVAVVLLAAAALASVVPARRATRVDPARALRAE